MKKFRTIYANFLAVIIPLLFLSFMCIIAVFEWFNYKEEYSKLLDKLSRLSVSQSIILADPVWKQDREQIQFIIASAISDPDVVSIRIYNRSGDLFDSFGSPALTKAALIKKTSINYADEYVIETIGTLVIGVTDKHVVANIISKLKQEAYLILLLLIATLVSTYLAQRSTVGIALQRLLSSITEEKKKGTRQLG
ncbi:MAG: hypothetical protein O7D86_05530 [Proteobacteria bacterium]|nr:hypothetical protein [Pseudomonadota bacterium]